MDRIGNFLLYIAAALYLFVNGILGFDKKGDFNDMSVAIFGTSSSGLGPIFTIVLAVIGVIAGALLLLKLFKIAIPRIELLMLIVIIVYAVFIVIVDVIGLFKDFNQFGLTYLATVATHLMVLGALITSARNTN
ncbi:MAG: hypothetical protein FWD14_05555 [Treponema sp.]|nr:hypothetical protein [Treponema sp.]